MFCVQKALQIFCQSRSISLCLILNSSRKASQIHQEVSAVLTPQKFFAGTVAKARTKKKTSKAKKVKRKRIVVKRISDDIEAIWLENLTPENLKLFRKTSFGSFRKINLENLFARLKELYPTGFGVEKLKEAPPNLQAPPEPEGETTGPCLSEFLIKHITQFPLLKSKKEQSFVEFAKSEADDFGDVDAQKFPSVTGILSETMSPVARLRLKRWKEQMVAKLGEKGFMKYQEDLLVQGSKFHSTLKTYLEIEDKSLVRVDPVIEGCWKSLENFLPEIKDVVLVEESIYHPVLMYKGIVDCVAHYRDVPCVIEWKKSSKLKSQLSSTYDAPLQLCAYLGALPWTKNVKTVKNGLVVVAYTDGSPANVFQMSEESCQIYWIEWLRRLQNYWLKKSPTIILSENEI